MRAITSSFRSSTRTTASRSTAGLLTRRASAALGALVLAIAACGDGSSGSGATSGASAAEPPAPAAPEDLAFECVLPAPDATWAKARAEIGGAAAFLPTTAGGLVAVTLRFPLAVSEAIDGRVPAVCAATLAKEAGPPRGVLGVHLRWPDRLLDGLTKGDGARFTARTDAATQIQIIEARDPKDGTIASGVLGNYLLLAARAEDLVALGPYVARAMPARAKDFPTAGVRIAGAKEEAPIDLVARVPGAALRGPIAAAGGRAWAGFAARIASMLPVPLPFVDDAGAALAVLPDLESAEIRVILGERTTRVEATGLLRKGSAGELAARDLPVGDAAPLLVLPKETLAAAFARRVPGAGTATPPGNGPTAGSASTGTAGTPTAGTGTSTGAAGASTGTAGTPTAGTSTPAGTGAPADASAATAAAIAKALGISETKDAAKLEALARAFDDARGGWTTAGFAFDGTGPSAFVRTAVRDTGALDLALKDFLALADGARPTDPVRGAKLRMSAGRTVLENIPGDVYRVRIARGGDAAKKGAEVPAAPTDTPTAVDVLFRRSNDVFVAAAGYASRDALRALLTAETGDSLQKVPEIAEPIARLGSGIALAAFFDPGRLAASRAGKPSSGSVAPVVIGFGRDLGDTVTVFARADAPSSALGELSRWISP